MQVQPKLQKIKYSTSGNGTVRSDYSLHIVCNNTTSPPVPRQSRGTHSIHVPDAAS